MGLLSNTRKVMLPRIQNPEWRSVLFSFMESDIAEKIALNLDKAYREGERIVPEHHLILDAFSYQGPSYTKVVILGQDPYPTPGVANGLAFSTHYNADKIPPTLKNIFKAIKLDTGENCHSGYLVPWAYQGVLLLNTTLTCEAGKPGSHSHVGWDNLIDHVLAYLSALPQPIVYMLWGDKAREKKKILEGNPNQLILESSHPSPQAVAKGFMFCKHFSKANEFLLQHKLRPITWRL